MATMTNMQSQLEIYENMCALSARMAEAAKTHDWDLLVNLESSVAKLRAGLFPEDNIKLSSGDAERKRILIQQILDDDAEVRRHTEPWMEELRQLIGEGRRRHQVEKAYRYPGF